MPHAIARISKLKSGNIASNEQHTKRVREVPNADPEINNIRIVGQPETKDSPNLETLVRQRIGDQTIRKNAVLCVEMLLTASPEYFRPDEPSKAGYYQPQRLEDFKEAVHQWLDNQYGDRIIRAELHKDEATPHIHAYLVPLDERGKLNCRGLFGGREKLSKFQDSYAEALAPLGLSRGIKGSRAKHTSVKQYYAAVNKKPDLTLDKETIQHQLADRQRAIKETKVLKITAQSLARDKEVLQQRLRDLETQIHQQNKELENWKTKYTELAKKVRDFPLEKVAYELGLDPDPFDKHKWHSEGHIINITGSKFYDWKALSGGGGAIDLVMHISDLVMHISECNFKQAVTWLNDRFGEGATIDAVSYKAREIIQEKPVLEFTPPVPEESLWQGVKKYLTRTRKLPSGLVDSLHEQGLIYADSKQNAVFIRRSIYSNNMTQNSPRPRVSPSPRQPSPANLNENKITGATLRGTAGDDNTFKGLAKGTKRSEGWFYLTQGGQSSDPIKRVVLVESPIDALSFAVLDRNDSRRTIYISTDGAGSIPHEFLRQYQDVVVAYDNDKAGNLMAKKVMSQLPNAVRKIPKAVDWNSELVNRFNWSKSSRNQEILRQPQQEQKRDRGLSL
ncbi:Plasmid recombination protein [Hyella patelloides LEGE 07179]|uniref:Plasmid recombination protein n=1 Tax=Hyella patelloides LEGE 07179 TaxID=945734 RepID=A0A563VNG5_9CYAN|nr:MobV family relaxase [Hyella patelloides]VEP12907.1 Plasmid recombination protein [Hyella patelloides LEGE 07179]